MYLRHSRVIFISGKFRNHCPGDLGEPRFFCLFSFCLLVCLFLDGAGDVGCCDGVLRSLLPLAGACCLLNA